VKAIHPATHGDPVDLLYERTANLNILLTIAYIPKIKGKYFFFFNDAPGRAVFLLENGTCPVSRIFFTRNHALTKGS